MVILLGNPKGLEFGRDLAWVMGRIVTARHPSYPARNSQEMIRRPESRDYETGNPPVSK